MHNIEPHFSWRIFYTAESDKKSPFFGRKYSEMFFTNKIYNYLIHPQWDKFGSQTLLIKILFADYQKGYAILEFIGEWNDAVGNDIMFLKRDIIDVLNHEGINKFILVGENVLNFHFGGDDYYEEWFQDVEDGWIVALNFQQHVLAELKTNNIDYYLNFGGELDSFVWRNLDPQVLFLKIESILQRRLN